MDQKTCQSIFIYNHPYSKQRTLSLSVLVNKILD